MTGSLTLYKITAEVEKLLESGFDPETGEMTPELGAALSKFEDKGNAVAAFILNQDATAHAIDETIRKLQARKKRIEDRAERLREYMQMSMKRTGITQITAEDGTFEVKLYPERDTVVEIFDERMVPVAYLNIPDPPAAKPNKAAIKKAINEGHHVPGAKLTKKDRLEIK